MNAVERRERRSELLELRHSDPLAVVALYRRAVGLNRISTVPLGMDLESLVDSIVDYETATGRTTFVDTPLQRTPHRSPNELAVAQAVSVAAGWLGLGFGIVTGAGR